MCGRMEAILNDGTGISASTTRFDGQNYWAFIGKNPVGQCKLILQALREEIDISDYYIHKIHAKQLYIFYPLKFNQISSKLNSFLDPARLDL